MSNVTANLIAVRNKIRQACLKRAVEFQSQEPRLVAVSKTKPKELILEAYNCGQKHFGENYVSEIVEKGLDEDIVKGCPDLRWHFIGHLQRKKVNKLLAVPNLFVVETLDSEKLADALNVGWEKIKGKDNGQLNVFIQVNTSGEEAKFGCKPDEAGKLMKYVLDNCKNLNVKGLMTIGKYDNYSVQDQINPDFQCLLNCKANICKEFNIDSNDFEVSMGMSGDFEHAIEVGATSVRVGSLIFGERLYKKKPYQVLLDGTICVAALKSKINVREQFQKYLDGDVKLLTTQCIVKEVEKLGSNTSGALYVLKNFGQHHCGHNDCSVPASDCILDMVGKTNSSRYIIATQDRELQRKCREIVGVPLLYFHLRVPTLEQPSAVTQSKIEQKSFDDCQLNESAKEKISKLKEGNEIVEPPRKKRKAKGGPNPLSCKKKKNRNVENGEKSNQNKRKRKRNRSGLVKKIKNELISSMVVKT